MIFWWKSDSSSHIDPSRKAKTSNLPSELWGEILVQVWLEDLMLLRCVSSSWRNVIDNPIFGLQHFIKSSTFSTHVLILSSSFGSYKLSFEKITPSITPGNELIQAKVFKFKNLDTPGHEISCLNNSNNGLVLLFDKSRHKFIVWNPLTRRHLKLPVSDLTNEFEQGMAYGVGVDELSKDCKVVLIRPHSDSSPDVFVYKVRTNSDNRSTPSCWKPMEDLPVLRLDFLSKSHGGVLLRGALHWIVSHEQYSKKAVLVFDLGTEKYRLIPLHILTNDFTLLELSVFKGCLCVSNRRYYQRLDYFEAYVMKEYGVEFWSRLYVVPPNGLGLGGKPIYKMTSVAYSNCGKWVLLCFGYGLVWYHLENKSAKNIKLEGMDELSWFTVTMYAGSLFPLDWDTSKPRKPPMNRVNRIDNPH